MCGWVVGVRVLSVCLCVHACVACVSGGCEVFACEMAAGTSRKEKEFLSPEINTC